MLSRIHVQPAFCRSIAEVFVYLRTNGIYFRFISFHCSSLSWWNAAEFKFPFSKYKSGSNSAHTNVMVAAHNWVFVPLRRPVAPPQFPTSMKSLKPNSEAPSPKKASLVGLPHDFSSVTTFSFLYNPLCTARASYTFRNLSL